MSLLQRKALCSVLGLLITLGAFIVFANSKRNSGLAQPVEAAPGKPILDKVPAAPPNNGLIGAGSINPQDPSNRGPIRNLKFTLYDSGIYPHEIRAQRGLFSIALEDRTQQSDGLIIERENGNNRSQVAHIRRMLNHWRGRDRMRLEPGRYRVADASQPEHQAVLIIEP